MAGFKDFVDGVPLFASELDGFLMRQTVMRFATTVAMVNALPAGIRENGMLAWTDNGGASGATNGCLWMFNGTNWVPWLSSKMTNVALPFTAGGTQITVANATVNSEWWYSGGSVKFNWQFNIGSSTNMQTGVLALAIPIAADNAFKILGQAGFYDFSATTMYHRAAVTIGTTTSIGFVDSNGTRWSTTSPIAFGQNDALSVDCEYAPSSGVYL